MLGGHVGGRSHHRANLCQAAAFQGAGQTEVHYHHPAAGLEHNILRLQIAVNHPLGVGRFERGANLAEKLDRFLGREFALFEQG